MATKKGIDITFATASTFGRKHAVIVVDAIDLVVSVHSEWHSVQAFVADAAPEASRMVRLAHGL